MSDMTMDRKFRLPLLPTAGALLLVPALAALGFWQLDRAGEKRDLAERYSAGGAAVVALASIDDAASAATRFPAVRVSGRYAADRQILLDALTHEGRPGYQVLTPLTRSDDGPTVLVNRGWVPAAPERATLPAIDVDDGPRTVQGRLAPLPRPGMRLAGDVTAAGWPRVMLFPTIADAEAALGEVLVPGQVKLDVGEPDGYLRDWAPEGLSEQRHLGYAAQWFALSATLAILSIVLAIRHLRRR